MNKHLVFHLLERISSLFLRRERPTWQKKTTKNYSLCITQNISQSLKIWYVCYHLAKLMASSGSWISSSSRCLSAIDCIFIRFSLVACCSVRMCGVESSPCWRRNCIDSRKRVYKLFLSASEIQIHRMNFVLQSSLEVCFTGWRWIRS